ncbi:MAG: hypothetical protein J3R72DRAFT_525201 [Linnemannia gamsii]|nr:MAG: hypothetical protein J3R72DRAFT_525201 [Linnemannia gamsii]
MTKPKSTRSAVSERPESRVPEIAPWPIDYLKAADHVQTDIEYLALDVAVHATPHPHPILNEPRRPPLIIVCFCKDFTNAEIENRASVLSQKRTEADVGYMDVGEDQDNDDNDDDEDDEDAKCSDLTFSRTSSLLLTPWNQEIIFLAAIQFNVDIAERFPLQDILADGSRPESLVLCFQLIEFRSHPLTPILYDESRSRSPTPKRQRTPGTPLPPQKTIRPMAFRRSSIPTPKNSHKIFNNYSAQMISSEPPPTQDDRLKTIEEELAKSVKLSTTTALTTKDQDEDINNSITHLLSIPKLDKVQNERMSTKSALCNSERNKATVKDRRTRDILTQGTYTGLTESAAFLPKCSAATTSTIANVPLHRETSISPNTEPLIIDGYCQLYHTSSHPLGNYYPTNICLLEDPKPLLITLYVDAGSGVAPLLSTSFTSVSSLISNVTVGIRAALDLSMIAE